MSELTIYPNEFTQPDYTITYVADDGRRVPVGRIFQASAGVPAETPWVWTVETHQRPGRVGPRDGHAVDLECQGGMETLLGVGQCADQLAASALS